MEEAILVGLIVLVAALVLVPQLLDRLTVVFQCLRVVTEQAHGQPGQLTRRAGLPADRLSIRIAEHGGLQAHDLRLAVHPSHLKSKSPEHRPLSSLSRRIRFSGLSS